MSGKHRTRAEINIDIRTPNPRTVEVVEKALTPGETWEQKVMPHGIAGTNEVTLEVSSIRPLNLERRLDYLIQYPHGCVEQTTSSVFPQLYLSTLVKLDEQKKRDIDANIRAGIDRLRLFQVASGGFTYWPGSPSELLQRLGQQLRRTFPGAGGQAGLSGAAADDERLDRASEEPGAGVEAGGRRLDDGAGVSSLHAGAGQSAGARAR